jgi:hypothetical protein
MAKAVIVKHAGETISFAPTKVDRAKIYGARKRIAVDAAGHDCTRASLTADGSQLLVSGMIAQAYFTGEGRWVTRNEMVGLDADGNKVDTKPSTLGIEQAVEGPVDPTEVLGLALQSVFFLEPEATSLKLLEQLKAGGVFKCPFNYTTGLEIETAYLVANDDGVFALVGKPIDEHWVQEGETFVAPEVEEDTDDLDFEAL